MSSINLDGIAILSLVRITTKPTDLTKLKFLNKLSQLYSLKYSFNSSNIKYWNISPLYFADPEDKKRTKIRLSALDGNGSFSGYKDFEYNRIDVGDYLSSLGSSNSASNRYLGEHDLDSIKNLIAQEFSEGEVSISEEIVGEFIKYTVTVTDPESLLWYGSGSISVKDIPELSSIIKLNELILID